MHPRNRFREHKPDFGAYIQVHKSLEQHLVKRKKPTVDGFTYTMDFSDPDALRELTCACLKHEFDLDLCIPLNHLIPTVPQRLNYIHWIEDLLSNNNGEIPKGNDVFGIDIGTGATCIYPLLGVKLNCWKFLATEIDKTSLKFAEINVKQNKLDDNITVQLVSSDDAILMGVVKDTVCYDFCMCNPPFFKDKEERTGLSMTRSGHRPIPQTQNTGNETETITEGGELKFVERIIIDSLKLRMKIRWYSSMVGKKSSLKELKAILKQNNVPVVITTEFSQGRTHRWGIAWSFNEQLKHKVVHVPTSTVKRTRPLSIILQDFEPTEEGMSTAFERVKNILDKLKISHENLSPPGLKMKCTASTNTWSHQRKRKRINQRLTEIRRKNESQARSGGCNTDEAPITSSDGCNTDEAPITSSDGCNTDEAPITSSDGCNTDEAPITSSDGCITEEGHCSMEKDLLHQLELLSVPCSVVFDCSLALLTNNDDMIIKKVKQEVELLEAASDNDLLQQILQHIQNNIKLS